MRFIISIIFMISICVCKYVFPVGRAIVLEPCSTCQASHLVRLLGLTEDTQLYWLREGRHKHAAT